MATSPSPSALMTTATALSAALAHFPASDGPVPPSSIARFSTALARLADQASSAPTDPHLVLAISDIAHTLRTLASVERAGGERGGAGSGGGAVDGGRSTQPSTSSFVRCSRKFLIAPGREAEVALALATRLPASVIGDRMAWSPFVTSLYLDDRCTFRVHAARSARADGAAMTRVRWYGEVRGASDAWVETKTHREPGNPGGPSSKDRVRVCRATAAALLDPGARPPPGLPALAAALAAAVRSPSTPLAPVLATQCRRLAFEDACKRSVRVTLDEGLVFHGGSAAELRTWVKNGGADPPAGCPSSAFPLAVLEVKTPLRADGTSAPPPVWLFAMVSDPAIAASAPRYSKYLSGAVALYAGSFPGLSMVGCVLVGGETAGEPPGDGHSATSVGPVTLLTPAVKPLEIVEAEAEEKSNPLPRAPRRGLGLLAWHRSRRARGVPASNSRVSLLPTAVAPSPPSSTCPSPTLWPPLRPAEAKTFFANERTFLAWLQVAVLLLLTGVSLLGNGGSARGTEVVLSGGEGTTEFKPTHSPAARTSLVAGAVVAPAAVAFLAYAFFVFRRRAARLRAGVGGSEGYSDVCGAALLAALALLAGVATLAAAFAKVADV